MDHTIHKVFHFKYYFTHRNVNSKNNLCEKAKADTRTPNSRQGEEKLIMTEMAVFTLQTDVR